MLRFGHVKVGNINWNGAYVIELSCPERAGSEKQYAPPGNVRFECEHVTAGFRVQIDPSGQFYGVDNCYERWKVSEASRHFLPWIDR